MRKKVSITINKDILKEIDSMVDKIYIRNRSQAVEHLVKNALGENKSAVILAGGKEEHQRLSSSEFRPTAKIGDSTVIEMAVKKLRENGFKTLYIVATSNVLTSIFDILKDGSLYGVKINYVEERGAKGSAHSLRMLKGKISTNFLVVYGDIIFDSINLEEIWKDHIKQRAICTLMLTTSSKPSEKGAIVMEGTKIFSFTQKPRQSDVHLVFSPIFATSPEIFEYHGDSLEKDVFPNLCRKGLLNGHVSSQKEVHIHSKEDALRFGALKSRNL